MARGNTNDQNVEALCRAAAIADKHDPDARVEREVELLRKALLPFAMIALTRDGQSASVPDDTPVTITMGDCRLAQKTMGA